MTDIAISLKNVTRTLTEEAIPVTLLKDINLDVKKGEFLAITGPSGSGKSSLVYLMGLLDSPTSGEIYIDGVLTNNINSAEKGRIRLEKIGFVFQFHFLLPEFTALENVAMPMRKLGKLNEQEIIERAEMLLNFFGVGETANRIPGKLSGGQRQRVAIARSMANDPMILITDEPTGNLDTKNSQIVFDLFHQLAKEHGKTIITITHELHLAKMADRMVNIVDGKIVTAEASK